MIRCCKLLLAFVVAGLFLTLIPGCGTCFLQNSSVLVNRKLPTITTSDGDNNLLQVAVSGSYVNPGTARYTLDEHTEYVSSDGTFDYTRKTNSIGYDSAVNNVPYEGENIHVKTSRWNANLQLSLVAFYRKTLEKTYRLQFLSEFQYSNFENASFRNYKFGPTFSLISKQFAFHPKIQFGYSKVIADYSLLMRMELWNSFQSETKAQYSWSADSGHVNRYRFFIEFGATAEFPFGKFFSMLTDLSGTYQYLFSYDGNYVHLSYVEFSPAVKISLGKNISLITGIALPLNPDMTRQLSPQYFMKMAFYAVPAWNKP
jgi:hypothetical protein